LSVTMVARPLDPVDRRASSGDERTRCDVPGRRLDGPRFALLGETSAVADAAVWISFLLAGLVAGLLGYTVGKLGVRFPSSGGLIAYLSSHTGKGSTSEHPRPARRARRATRATRRRGRSGRASPAPGCCRAAELPGCGDAGHMRSSRREEEEYVAACARRLSA
jgi:hypothetical protein